MGCGCKKNKAKATNSNANKVVTKTPVVKPTNKRRTK